jgi:tRNA threonylcarbamoyladenosine biosynthesis protein TsaB
LLVVGIDVSAEKGIVFLGQEEGVLVKKVIGPYSSSEKLLPLLDVLLKERELGPESLEGIIVSLGPGSFTGLRIGVCLAKGLAFALKVPLIGVSTFDSWIFSSSAQGILCPLKRAHSSRFYGAFYKKDKGMRRVSEYLFLPLKRILKKSREFSPQRVSFLTSCELQFNELDPSLSTLPERIIPGEALLKFGIHRLNKGESDDISSLSPLYVAPPKVGFSK